MESEKEERKIVCFGGGSAIPNLVMKPLKDEFFVVGVTSMVDNGGSTGVIRREFNVLPPGDIRRHMLALSEAEEWKKNLWNFKFLKDLELSPGHYGHKFSNIFIAGLEHLYGVEKCLEYCHDFLKVKGKALPATKDKVQLVAELEDGALVEGEDEIDVGQNHDRTKRVKKVYLDPDGEIYEETKKEIESADYIIIGPGDLYTSLIACFLPKGMKEAIQKTKAKKIFICPAMTKLGETQGFSVLDFAREIEKYIGRELDYVLYNTTMPEKERIDKYKEEGEFLIDVVRAPSNLNPEKFLGRDLLSDKGEIKHDEKKLLNALKEILQN